MIKIEFKGYSQILKGLVRISKLFNTFSLLKL